MSDLFDHLGCETDTFVAALKRPGRLIVRIVMIDSLSHGELVKIVFQQALNDLFHYQTSSFFIIISHILRKICYDESGSFGTSEAVKQ